MLKKYMIFGSVVLLLAALLTMTGCSQATDSDGGTTAVYSENHLFGTADQVAVKRAVESAKRTGRSVVISDGTVLTSSGSLPGVADFEKLPVRVEGSVWVDGGVIVNAAFANLSFAEGATITVRNSGAFIYQGDDAKIGTDPTSSLPGYKVRYVTDALLGTQGTDRHVAISDYTITNNYRTLIAPHITNLYVLNKLTIDAGSIKAPGDGTDANSIGPDSSPRVIALGTVALEASNSLVFGALSPDSNHFQFTSSAVLTSTVPSLTLTLSQERATLPTIDATVPLTIQKDGPINTLTIDKIQGPAPLTITNGANTFGRLIIGEVVEGAQVAVGTGGMFGATNSGLKITKNAGFVSLTAASLTTRTKLEADANTGTITIKAPINDVEVIVGDNSGTLNIDTEEIDGDYDYNSPPLTPSKYSGVFVAKNTGEVNFVQSLTVGVEYGIRAPVNNGTINFYGTFTGDATFPLGNDDPERFIQNIGGSGKLVFGALATFNGPDTNIDCNTVFNGGFTQAADTELAFGGDVTLANGQSITIWDSTAPADVPSTTLKEGKKLLVGDVPVLIGGATGAIIQPPGDATNPNEDAIKLIAGIRDPDDEDDLGYRTLVLRGGVEPITSVNFVGIDSITGELRVAGTGLLFNENTIDTGSGTLTLEDGAILLLPEDDNEVTIGDTVIAGLAPPPGTPTYYPTPYPAPVQFVASGGAVSLGPNKISGRGASLVSPEDITGGPTITVGDSSSTGGKSLIIAGVNLDLQFGGALTISQPSGAPANYVTLEAGSNPGKITLSDDTGTTYGGSLGGTGIDFGGTDGTFDAADIALSGTGVLLGDSETLPCAIGTISGAPNGRLTLTGLSTGSAVSIGTGAGLGNTVVGP